jgi:hypothetical protein
LPCRELSYSLISDSQEVKDIETRKFGKGKRKKGGGGDDDDDNANSQGVRKRLKGNKKGKKHKK